MADHPETAELNDEYSAKEKAFLEAMSNISVYINDDRFYYNNQYTLTKFIEAYQAYSNISDEIYQNQRAVSAYYSLCHRTRPYISPDDFIKALKGRFRYDWHHKDPISPGFFRSVLESIASLSEGKTINIYLTLFLLAVPTIPIAIISTTIALGIGLVLGLSTAILSPAFLIAAGIAVITTSIVAIEAGIAYSLSALRNSDYNLDNLFMLEGDDTPTPKYSHIGRYSDHATAAQKDLTLRPWRTFFAPEKKPENQQGLLNNEVTLGQS